MLVSRWFGLVKQGLLPVSQGLLINSPGLLLKNQELVRANQRLQRLMFECGVTACKSVLYKPVVIVCNLGVVFHEHVVAVCQSGVAVCK